MALAKACKPQRVVRAASTRRIRFSKGSSKDPSAVRVSLVGKLPILAVKGFLGRGPGQNHIFQHRKGRQTGCREIQGSQFRRRLAVIAALGL